MTGSEKLYGDFWSDAPDLLGLPRFDENGNLVDENGNPIVDASNNDGKHAGGAITVTVIELTLEERDGLTAHGVQNIPGLR